MQYKEKHMQCNKDNKQRVIHRETRQGGQKIHEKENRMSMYASPNMRHPNNATKNEYQMKRRVEKARRIDIKWADQITDTPPKRSKVNQGTIDSACMLQTTNGQITDTPPKWKKSKLKCRRKQEVSKKIK